MEIEKIYIYPIKSLRPISVKSATIGRYGFVNDRTFMLLRVHRNPETSGVIRFENMHISDFPRMALFLTSFEPELGLHDPLPRKVIVAYSQPTPNPPDQPSPGSVVDQISIPLEPATHSLENIQVEMHKSPTIAHNMGASYNDWFSTCFGHEVILAFVGSNSRAVLGNLSPDTSAAQLNPPSISSAILGSLRSLIPHSNTASIHSENESRIAFQDCAHFLVVTSESLADVSARLPDNQVMDVTKFRPNLVLSGVKDGAWAEDYWSELAIADDVVVRLTANCVRCQSINVDYITGAPGTDESGTVLKKLQKDRRVDAGAKYSPCFGRYGFRRKDDIGKEVSVGMGVSVTKVNEERTKIEWPGLFGS